MISREPALIVGITIATVALAVAGFASMPSDRSFLAVVEAANAPLQPAETATPAPTPLPGVCRVDAQSGAAPSNIYLDQTAVVTTHVTAQCTAAVFPLHVVLVLDASSDLDARTGDAIRDTALALVPCILDEDDPWLKVAVVDFAATARQLCPFSSDKEAQLSCVSRSRPRAGRKIDTALTAARGALDRERNRLPAWMGDPAQVVREVVVLVAGGENNLGCTPALRAASALKQRGILLMAMWADANSTSPCLRQMATSARYYFERRVVSDPCQVFARIRSDIIAFRPTDLAITHTLPANVVYEPSGDPEAAPTTVPGYLVWRTAHLPQDGFTVTARLRPLEVGHLGIVSETRLTLRTRGYGSPSFASLTIPGPQIDVLPPLPSATPTLPPTPTATPAAVARRRLYIPAVDTHANPRR